MGHAPLAALAAQAPGADVALGAGAVHTPTMRALVCFVSLCGVVAAFPGAAPPRAAAPPTLTIETLRGSVVPMGSWDGFRMLGVRLRARVCDRAAPRGGTFPDEIRIAQYEVHRRRTVWRLRRASVDRASWLVPLQEVGWRGQCGVKVFEDAIPPTHYGVESLGNPVGCYGVSLSIRDGTRAATRRAVLHCGGLHGG